MTNFATKIGQLYMENEDNARSFLGMYIADPTPLEEKNLGRVYTLIEISNDLDEANEVIDIINQSISNAYYQSTSFEIEIALETALKSLNKKLQQITSELGEDWLDKISAIIAVQKGQEIHFAQIGTIHAFLVQDKKIIEIGGANKEKINPLKIFSNILSGNLTKKSTLIFCTESILDYVSQEKLRKTVTENDPKDAATYLQNLLSESSNQTNFGALFLKVTEQTAGEAAGVKTDAVTFESNGDEDSMENLVSKEKNTSELLAPSIWPGIKKNIQKIKRPKNQEFSEESIETHEESEEELPVPSKIKETRKKETKTLEIFQKIGKVLKNIGIQIINGVAALGRGITGLFKKRKEYPQKMKSLPQKTTGWFSKIVDWFKELSTPRKVLLILVIVIVFVLAQSLMRTELNKETKEEKDQYEQIIEDINQKMAEVDNMLLMNNEDGARKLLVESKEKLDQVPKDSKIYEEKGVETANNIQIGLDKVFNVNRITDPETSIDYSQISSDVGVSNIERIGDTIYAYDNNSDSVYSGKLEDGSTQVVVDNQGGPTLIAVAKDSAATTLGWSDENTLVQFNPVLEKLSEVGIGETADSINISDLKVFGSRLYALSKDGQIYKFTADGDNYGDSAPWLTEDNILSNSKSLAIDGAVYVVDGNGEIKKFFSGVVDDEFSLDAVEPVLTNPSLIYTDENITSIYLLDPENKRALRFNKEGELTSQYISDKFDNLTDLVVDEDTGKLYLLNGSQVYMVKI